MDDVTIHRNREKTYQIYDAFKTALLNKKYYARRMMRLRHYNFWMEIVIIAGTTGSGVAGFAVWQLQGGKIAWGFLSAASVLLVIAKPLLRLTERIEEYATLYGEYTGVFARMKMLVDDMQVDRTVSDTLITIFDELRTRSAELARLGEPNPSQAFIKRLQGEVNEAIPIAALWVPADGENADQGAKTSLSTSLHWPSRDTY